MSKAVSSISSLTSKTCQACGDYFSPEVSKVGLKYCSTDCLYDSTGEVTENCPNCGDEFLKEFTKTSAGCSKECEAVIDSFLKGFFKYLQKEKEKSV